MVRSIPAWAGEPALCFLTQRSLKVYPRVGGGTHGWVMGEFLLIGLSPRGRGNQKHLCRLQYCYRSIPAWAGEPFLAHHRGALDGVYPRVGGGTSSCQSIAACVSGLSPRGRGNPYGKLVAKV